MYDLFNPPPEDGKGNVGLTNREIDNVKGLKYVPNYVSKEEQEKLIAIIRQQPWLTDIKRRVQHYGYKYDYKARNIDYSMFLGDLPIWAATIAQRLHEDNYIEDQPDQVIVNEYLPGQGIANHVDCEPCFGETIISISLCSKCIMDFMHTRTKQKVEVLLEPGSLVVINDEARHIWKHGIPARKVDVYEGERIDRGLRLSMTFRKVILKGNQKFPVC
jgi:alkylated DNA repair dioxygenase AlkB